MNSSGCKIKYLFWCQFDACQISPNIQDPLQSLAPLQMVQMQILCFKWTYNILVSISIVTDWKHWVFQIVNSCHDDMRTNQVIKFCFLKWTRHNNYLLQTLCQAVKTNNNGKMKKLYFRLKQTKQMI